MLFSYAMGVGEAMLELEKEGFVIVPDKGDYKVTFPYSKRSLWEKFIETNLKEGFWNEYITDMSDEIVFLFKTKQGIKRYVVKDYTDSEVLELCENFANCKFGNIKDMIVGNKFYSEVMKSKGLLEFLVRAKKNTYANGDASRVSSSRTGSKDYHYTEIIDNKEVVYHDTYFGGERFIGEEVLYVDGTPLWAMNYYGNTLDESLSEEAMDNALRPALMQVGKDEDVLAVRGPSKYLNGEYSYTFESLGSMDNFTGLEKIYKKDKLIYQLHCHGGRIK